MDLNNENVWLDANQNQRRRPQAVNPKTKVDEAVSKIVGRDVLTTDPVLLNLLAEWKKKVIVELETITDKNGKEVKVEKPVNLLENKDFIKALKNTYEIPNNDTNR